MVERAHAAGMQLVPWTVNDQATMRALIGSGVDGIITDYPDRLREVVADSDMKLPRSFGLQPGRQAGVPAFHSPV